MLARRYDRVPGRVAHAAPGHGRSKLSAARPIKRLAAGRWVRPVRSRERPLHPGVGSENRKPQALAERDAPDHAHHCARALINQRTSAEDVEDHENRRRNSLNEIASRHVAADGGPLSNAMLLRADMVGDEPPPAANSVSGCTPDGGATRKKSRVFAGYICEWNSASER